jgi:hypothetical protein
MWDGANGPDIEGASIGACAIGVWKASGACAAKPATGSEGANCIVGSSDPPKGEARKNRFRLFDEDLFVFLAVRFPLLFMP